MEKVIMVDGPGDGKVLDVFGIKNRKLELLEENVFEKHSYTKHKDTEYYIYTEGKGEIKTIGVVFNTSKDLSLHNFDDERVIQDVLDDGLKELLEEEGMEKARKQILRCKKREFESWVETERGTETIKVMRGIYEIYFYEK